MNIKNVLGSTTETLRGVAVSMGVMSAYVAVDQAVRSFVEDKVRTRLRGTRASRNGSANQ